MISANETRSITIDRRIRIMRLTIVAMSMLINVVMFLPLFFFDIAKLMLLRTCYNKIEKYGIFVYTLPYCSVFILWGA